MHAGLASSARARRIGVRALALIALFATVLPACAAGVFVDPLDAPAPPTRLATTTQLSAIAKAGERLVAVGIRGLIVVSDDAGKTWRQIAAPVSSDLLAVQFPTPQLGWISGHDGVVLHSADGGSHWIKQLDGRATATQLSEHFQKLAEAGDATAARLINDVKLNYQNGPEQALLDVWFDDAEHGFVAGSFGTLLATDDGGQSWKSWMENVDNGDLLHYNAIRGIGGNVYIASERGIVFKLDRDRHRFVAHATGYAGSFFTVAGDEHALFAFGLRGSAYRSRDAGETWQRIETGFAAGLTASTVLGDGSVLVASQGGRLLRSLDAGSRFTMLDAPRTTVLSGVAQAGDHAIVVGMTGIQRVDLDAAAR